MQHDASMAGVGKVPALASMARPWQLMAALVLGAVVLYGAGFLNTAAAHNAAHDARHSQGFPCH